LNQIKPFGSDCTALYFYLLEKCNCNHWVNPFGISTGNIEETLHIGRKAFTIARNTLKQRGLIGYREGKGKTPAMYTLLAVDIKSVDEAEKEVRERRKNPHRVVSYRNNSETTRKQLGNNSETTTPIIINNKTKDVKTIRECIEKTPPPTLEKVKEIFESKNRIESFPDWELSAQRFFDHYSMRDWKYGDAGIDMLQPGKLEHAASLWISEDRKRMKNLTLNRNGTNTSRPTASDAATEHREMVAGIIARYAGRSAEIPIRDGTDLPI
jgi:hypothetical protein